MSATSKKLICCSSLSKVGVAVGFLVLILFFGAALGQAQSGGTQPLSAPSTARPGSSPAFSPLPPDLAQTNQAVKNKASAPDANKTMETLDDKHLLAIGDRISFRILEDEEESKALVVADSGEIELPGSLGRFAATGKSCKELARIVKTELEKEYYYQATVLLAVDLMARSRGKIYIVGPVRAPGPQDIPSDETLTLSKAILRAGDFTDFADKKRVKVTRKTIAGGDETFIVNVAEILEKGRKEADLALQSDDLIYVQERLIRF